MGIKSVFASVVIMFLTLCGSLCGQVDSERVFGEIHEYMKGDIRSRTFSSPLLFVGEISGLGPVFDGVCKSAVNENVDFAVSELLLGDLSDESFHYGYPNCTRQPLPSPPFSLHAQVILYCHRQYSCFQPVPATSERVKAVRAWVAEARHPEDDAAYVQFRQAVRKASPLQTGRDFVFEGEIANIQPVGTFACTIALPRKVGIHVVKVLFGETKPGPVEASYGSVNCPVPMPLSVRLHAKVIVYCSTQPYANLVCLKPVEDSPRRLAQVESWIAAQSQPQGSAGGAKP